MDLTTGMGWTATVLFTVCYIPQILKTMRTKTVDGLSFRLLFVSFIANIIAFFYATRIKQQPLQIKYIFALVFVSICLYLYLRIFFKNRSEEQKQQ